MTIMGKKKRKVGDSEEKVDIPPSKKKNTGKSVEPEAEKEEIQEDEKSSSTPFDIKLFRKNLSSISNRLVGLTQFLHVCTKSNGKIDYIQKYLDNGGSPGEILKQLEGQSRKDSLLTTTVFELFYLIISKIQSSAAHLLQSLEDTSRYFLSTYISNVELMLSEKSNPKQQIITLKLLTTMVTLNSELGLTVLNQLSFQPKMLGHLVRANKMKGKDNVRPHFVNFLMSFLVDNSPTLTKTLLNKQGLLGIIFPGLINDSSDIVLSVMELLKNSVLNNSAITKTAKIHLFSHQVISHIFNLFNWGKRVKTENVANEINSVKSAVEELLLILFTSTKNGIYFFDSTLGTSDIPKNKYLWKAIEMLDAPWNNEHAGQCIIRILSVNPEMWKPVKSIIENSYDSKYSEQWLKTVHFLMDAVTSIKPESIINKNIDMDPVIVADYIKNIYLSTPILLTSKAIFKTKNEIMIKEVIKLLHTLLNSVQNIMNMSESDYVLFKSVKTLLKSRSEEIVSKYFPNVDDLILTLHSVLDKVEKENLDVEETTAKSKLLINLLDFLLAYDEILPNSFNPILVNLDTKRLFEKIEFFNPCDRTELKLKAITFLLCADKLAFSPDKPLFKEILPAMFEVLIQDDKKMANEAHKILFEILNTIDVFSNNKIEISIILYIVPILVKKYDYLLQMIVELLEDVILNGDKYKAEFSKYSSVKNKIDTQSKENIGVIFNNLENFSKNKKELYFIEDRPLFTFFIVGLLKNIGKRENYRECMQDFSNKFACCLLHFQDNPDSFVDIISRFKKEADIDNYIFSWKSEPLPISKKLFNKKSLIYKLSSSLLSGTEIDIEDMFDLKRLEDLSLDKKCLKIGESIYAFDDVLMTQSELMILLNIVLFYIVQQNKLNILDEIKMSNAKKALVCILDTSLLLDKSKKLYIDSLQRFLGNPDLLNNFNPFDLQPSLISNMIFDIFTHCSDKGLEAGIIDVIYRPYKNKLFLFLMKEIQLCEKAKRGTKINNIEKVLSLLSLDFNDSVSLLVGILKLDVCVMETDTNEASSWIFVICHILQLCVKNCLSLLESNFSGILNLYHKIIGKLDSVINVSDLELCIYDYLLVNPSLIEKIPDKIFETMFTAKHNSKNTAKVGCILLSSNEKLLPIFIKYASNDEFLAKREFMIPLALTAFKHPEFKSESNVLKNIYKYYKSNVQKIIEKPQKASQIYIENVDLFIKLIYHCMEMDECEMFLKKVHKFDAVEIFHIRLIETIFYKFTMMDENKANFKYLENFLLTVMQILNIALKRDEIQLDKVMKISESLTKILTLTIDHHKKYPDESFDFKNFIKNSIWQNSFKFSLKALLKSGETSQASDIIGNISCIINTFYPQDDPDVVDLFDMTTSHSEFLNVMLNMQSSNVKTQLAKLLYVLVCKNKSVMKVSHIPVYLSAYQASRNYNDRILLSLLRLYESNGNSMIEYRPYLWSEIGANYFALKSNRKKTSLWSNPTVNHVLNLLDKEMIERTIKNFPIDQELNYDSYLETLNDAEINNCLYKTVNDAFDNINKMSPKKCLLNNDFDKYIRTKLSYPTYKSALQILTKNDFQNVLLTSNYSEIYDPAFLLPMLNFTVAPGSMISCHRILRCGILAIPLMALSSSCPLMRSAAYNILHRFYNHLESEMFYKNDKLLWTQFLDTLKCSLKTAIENTEKNLEVVSSASSPRLPAICSLYLARSALVMTNPLDPLFKPVNDFIISKQFINFTIVPDLLDLFHNTDITYIERRTWILKVIRDGVKTFEDIKVLLKSVTFKLLLDFYSCSLSDVKTKLLILDILNVTISIPRAAKILVDSYGLFPWLNTTFKSFEKENKECISKGIDIIHNLFIALVTESTSKILDNQKNNAFEVFLAGKCFRLSESLHFEFLFLILSLINRIPVMNIVDLKKYLEVLKKLSNGAFKQITRIQIMKLVQECELVADSARKHCKTITSSISGSNRNTKLLVISLSIMNNMKNCTEKDEVIKLLHEIVIRWTSDELIY